MPRPKSFEPDEALNQMMHVFWDKGFEATSVADLEAATGLNKRSIYNTFGNKEAIFTAALSRYIAMSSEMGAVLLREPLGLKNVKDFFSAIRYEPGAPGCLVAKTLTHRGVVPATTFEHARNAILETEALVNKNIVAAFGRNAKARRLTAFLTSIMQGISTMSRVDPDPKRLKDVVASVFAVLDNHTEQ
jgi:TetR/AcrR family transcriptional repressor of nem operon